MGRAARVPAAVPLPDEGRGQARRREIRRLGHAAGAAGRAGGSVDIGPAVLLATEGRPFARETIARAAELAREYGGSVHVLAIGRVHGTSFGFPNPGLLPTRAELEELYAEVDKTIERLERKGVDAKGEVIATRNGAKRIAKRAERLGCQAIVMAADAKANPMKRNFMWSQEPQRVARRSKVPVHLVEVT